MAAIGPGDPEYDTVMREAKALFEAATAKAAAKGRGRPRNPTPAADAPPQAAAGDVDDLEDIDDVDEIEDIEDVALADEDAPDGPR